MDDLIKRLERLAALVGNEELRTVCLQARDALEAKDKEIRTLINRCADLMRDKATNLAEIKRLRGK